MCDMLLKREGACAFFIGCKPPPPCEGSVHGRVNRSCTSSNFLIRERETGREIGLLQKVELFGSLILFGRVMRDHCYSIRNEGAYSAYEIHREWITGIIYKHSNNG